MKLTGWFLRVSEESLETMELEKMYLGSLPGRNCWKRTDLKLCTPATKQPEDNGGCKVHYCCCPLGGTGSCLNGHSIISLPEVVPPIGQSA